MMTDKNITFSEVFILYLDQFLLIHDLLLSLSNELVLFILKLP